MGAETVPVNAPIEVEFNEAVDALTLDASSLQLVNRTTGLAVPTTLALDASERVLTITPLQPLAAGTLHELDVFTTVTDIAGNRLSQGGFTGYFSSTFTVAFADDMVAPTVVATSPANGASGVAVNA